LIKIRIEDLGDSQKKAIESLQRIKKDMPDIVLIIIKRWCEEIIKIAQKNYLNAGQGDSEHLHRRTGKLAASITYWLNGKFSADVGSDLVYARIHEEGGTIFPGAKGFLAWPIQVGVYLSRSGALLKKPTRKTVAYAYTRKTVTIPARPYIRPSIQDYFASDTAERMAELTLDQEFARRAQ
jgi:phage gpG-like protein